jgi:hypothetical protein
MGLLEDTAAPVVREALAGCSRSRDPQLIAGVLPLLGQHGTREAAAQTLTDFGKDALPHLLPYLQLGHTDGAFSGASRIPDILATIGDPASLPALHERILDPTDAELQESAVRAYCRLAERGPLTKSRKRHLEEAVESTLSQAEHLNRAYQDALGVPGAEIFTDALRHERDSRVRCTFRLLDLQVQGVDLAAVHGSLNSEADATRANALEILDNVLKGETKTRLLAILERAGRTEKVRAGTSECVADFLSGESAEWVTVGAVYAAAENEWVQTRDRVADLVHNPSPAVRETALFALGRFGTHPALESARDLLATDSDARVRHLAESMSVSYRGGKAKP